MTLLLWKAFEEYGSEIAALIVEPCAANMGVVPPEKGFLEFLREVTKSTALCLYLTKL